MLLPPGMHQEALKKGDIVLNAEQTSSLLRTGRAMGKGKAYANGTLSNAYASGVSASGTWRLGGYGGTSSSGGGGGGGSYTYSPPVQAAQSVANSAKDTAKSTEKAADKADDFKETLDEIEILLDRVDREIEHIDRTAQGVYNTFVTRNSAIYDEIGKIASEIDILFASYKRYIKQAESLKLDASWVAKIQSGSINIEEVKDEDLWDKIEEYREWYEKALDVLDTIDDLKDTQAELDRQRFDNLQKQFEGLIQKIESAKTIIEDFIDLTEEEGHLVAAEYYTEMIKYENQELQKLVREREALTEELVNAVSKGRIEVGSEEFNDMQEAIDDVSDAILKAKKNLVEFQNQIRQLEWDRFDMGIDWADDLIDELEFLNELTDTGNAYDERGKVTDEGIARFGAITMAYDSQLQKAQWYADEIKKIERDLARDPYNLVLIDRKRELIKAQQESILASKKEKEAVRDLVKEGIEKQIDYLSRLIEEYETLLDMDQSEIEYARRIAEQQREIDKYNKQIMSWQGDNSEEGAARRQKTADELRQAEEALKETQEEHRISEIKAALSDLQDNFSEVINRRLDDIDALLLSVIDGVNANAITVCDKLELESANVGYTISDRLSTSMNEAKESVKAAIAAADANGSISALGMDMERFIQSLKEGNKASLDLVNNNALALVTGMKEGKFITPSATILSGLGTIPSDINAMAYNARKEAAQRIAEENKRKAEEAARIKKAQQEAAAKKAAEQAKRNTPAAQPQQTQKKQTAQKPSLTDSIRRGVAAAIWNGNYGWGVDPDRANKLNEVFGGGNGIQNLVNQGVGMYGDPNGYSYLEMRRKFRGYAKGIKKVDRDEVAITQENGREFILHNGEILTPLSQGDSVFNKVASDNLWNLANNPTDFMRNSMFKVPDIRPVSITGGNSNISVSISLPNVTDYASFKRDLQSDKKFIQLMQEATLGQTLGHGKLAKNAIRF